MATHGTFMLDDSLYEQIEGMTMGFPLGQHRDSNSKANKEEKEYLFRIGMPYFENPSHKFAKRLSVLVKTKFHVDLAVYIIILLKLILKF